jgi:hypothetical protein
MSGYGMTAVGAKRPFPKSGKNYFSVHCHSAASVALADEVIE